MVAASKNFRTKRKQRQVISAQFSRNSAASAALRATQYRGVQSNNIFVSWGFCGENWSLGSVDQNGNTLKYDAWNRLISVTNSSGQIIAKYSYDALGRRVSLLYPVGGPGEVAGETTYLYFSTQGQILESRAGGTANSDVTAQHVWSAVYVNAQILRDGYSGGVIQPSLRTYYLFDANYNVTALVGNVGGSWQVTQRYIYSPYGSLTVANPNWTIASSQLPNQYFLYQGGFYDPVTGLYWFNNRNYSPVLGVWTSQDPAQYINGADTYQFVESGPVGSVDPWGLADTPVGQVNKIAKNLGLTEDQRNYFGDLIHEYKEERGWPASKNLSPDEFKALAKQAKNQGGGRGSSCDKDDDNGPPSPSKPAGQNAIRAARQAKQRGKLGHLKADLQIGVAVGSAVGDLALSQAEQVGMKLVHNAEGNIENAWGSMAGVVNQGFQNAEGNLSNFWNGIFGGSSVPTAGPVSGDGPTLPSGGSAGLEPDGVTIEDGP